MREIEVDGKTMRVRATPLALLYYQQAFKSDLIGDLLQMQKMEKDPTQIDSLLFLRITWAMAKADSPKNFPSFEGWLESLSSFDFSDSDLLQAVMEEATDGFFRRGTRGRR